MSEAKMEETFRSVIYSHRMRDFWMKKAREEGKVILPLKQVQLANCAVDQHCSIKECCVMCGIKISVAIFKGTGVCSELCRKDRDNDHGRARAVSP